jgi:hypothetical protein
MTANPIAGKWTYRSLLNDPGLSRGFDNGRHCRIGGKNRAA